LFFSFDPLIFRRKFSIRRNKKNIQCVIDVSFIQNKQDTASKVFRQSPGIFICLLRIEHSCKCCGVVWFRVMSNTTGCTRVCSWSTVGRVGSPSRRGPVKKCKNERVKYRRDAFTMVHRLSSPIFSIDARGQSVCTTGLVLSTACAGLI
jgi:hypothetical protein